MAAPPTSAAEDELRRARDLGIDTCGRIVEFWGFTRTMGRTFGLLYLSREPLPQAEIQGRLGISARSPAMTLAARGRWGVAHRVWVRGQRREHYQAETDFWKMISGVLNERERREIGAAVEAVARAVAAARAAEGAAPRRLAADADFTVERLERLHGVCALGETMLDMLLGQLTLDVGRFRDVLKVEAPPRAEPPARRRPRRRPRRAARRSARARRAAAAPYATAASGGPPAAPPPPAAPSRGALGLPHAESAAAKAAAATPKRAKMPRRSGVEAGPPRSSLCILSLSIESLEMS